jgi:endonuclease/exonuclease/phosphatase family metal-dependent hydrolase
MRSPPTPRSRRRRQRRRGKTFGDHFCGPARNWTHGEAEPKAPLAAIWMGDFNMEPGSAEYRRIVGDNPYHRGAGYLDGFADAAAAPTGYRPEGLYTHVKTIDGVVRRRQLDHCFVGSTLARRVVSVRADNEQTASDHHPLWVEIDLETQAAGVSAG